MNKMFGLIHNAFSDHPEDTSWIFDSFSTETFGASWNSFGYEIIFRLEEIHVPARVMQELREAFMEPFGLSKKNYRFEPTFWRIYWNQVGLRASMIQKCENALDKVANRHGITIRSNGILIQPRPMGYLQQMLEFNK
jgi:hypothetical protein